MSKNPKELSRRDVLKGAVAAGAGAATASVLGPLAASRSGATAGLKWDKTADVVVVGAGAAGLPAAIEAAQNE